MAMTHPIGMMTLPRLFSRLIRFENAWARRKSMGEVEVVSERPDHEYRQFLHFSSDLDAESATFKADLVHSMMVHANFLRPEEEDSLLAEVEPYLKRMRYEYDHWDNAIHGYRETERLNWTEANGKTLQRVGQLAFPGGGNRLKHVHVLDLDRLGYIKPHVDAVRFCGDTIAGLSLLSDSVMRLVHAGRKSLYVDVLLERRSLYVMKGTARYDYTHEILDNEHSRFRGRNVPKTRRVSIICRNEPTSEDAN